MSCRVTFQKVQVKSETTFWEQNQKLGYKCGLRFLNAPRNMPNRTLETSNSKTSILEDKSIS